MEPPLPLYQPFDKKYKTIIHVPPRLDYMNLIGWVNQNSIGSVDVRFVESAGMDLYFGFENKDDAIIFKIKFL